MKTVSRFLFVVVALFASHRSFADHSQSLRGRYFAVIFGYQGTPNRAVDSHTFAAFLTGEDLERGDVYDPATISWLPRTGVVRPLRKEPGRNFSLSETIDIARRNRYEVRAFGPYEITADLYRRALRQIRFLESGAVEYKMIPGPLAGNAINCIMAVSQIGGSLKTGAEWGFDASALVTQHLSPWMIRYPYPNYDVAELMGLHELVGRH